MDAAHSFATGVELQGNLMSRILQQNQAKQQMDQSRAMLPLRLQALENENELNRLNITSQAYKNQIEGAKIDDQATLAHATTALTLGQDPGPVSFKTPEAASTWMTFRAHSAMGQRDAADTAAFFSRLANPALRGEDVSSVREILSQARDGVIPVAAWKKLTTIEAIAHSQDLAEKADAEANKLKMQNQLKLEQIHAAGEERYRTAELKLRDTIANSPSGTAEQRAKIDLLKRNFINQAAGVRLKQNLSLEQQHEELNRLNMEFNSKLEDILHPGAGGAATTQPPVDPSVQGQVSKIDEKLTELNGKLIELDGKRIEGKRRLTGSWEADIAEVNRQINAWNALKTKLSGTRSGVQKIVGVDGKIIDVVPPGEGAPVHVPEASSSLPIPLPPTEAPSAPAPAPKLGLEDVFAAFGLSDKPAPQFGEGGQLRTDPITVPAPAARSGMAQVISDGLKIAQGPATSKNVTAVKFWEAVKAKLGVPGHAHSTKFNMRDPRFKSYYNSLPDEVKQSIFEGVLKRAESNPKEFMPILDYYLGIK